MKDTEHQGCPLTITRKENIDKTRISLKDNGRLIVRVIAQLANFYLAGVHEILIKFLKAGKINNVYACNIY